VRHAVLQAQLAKRASFSSRGGNRATDESGAWRLRTAQDSSADPDDDGGDLHAALTKAQEQLDSLETDVQSLEFVAGHPVFEDVCDLDMHYNNPHLEVISWASCAAC
jgi:hypothetical protein